MTDELPPTSPIIPIHHHRKDKQPSVRLVENNDTPEAGDDRKNGNSKRYMEYILRHIFNIPQGEQMLVEGMLKMQKLPKTMPRRHVLLSPEMLREFARSQDIAVTSVNNDNTYSTPPETPPPGNSIYKYFKDKYFQDGEVPA